MMERKMSKIEVKREEMESVTLDMVAVGVMLCLFEGEGVFSVGGFTGDVGVWLCWRRFTLGNKRRGFGESLIVEQMFGSWQ